MNWSATGSGRHRRVGYTMFLLLPLLLAAAAGYAKYAYWQQRDAGTAGAEAVQAADAAAVAMLSYGPDTVGRDLSAAGELMTGPFRDTYSTMVNDVVAPAARQKKITATAKIPAAVPVSASGDRAVVLLFIDQTLTVGKEPPSTMNSSARISMEKREGRWLVSGFEPI